MKFIILISILLFFACAPKPPHEAGHFKPSDLVELKKLSPDIKLDIRYATNANLAGRPVYKEARAFLQRPAAEALLKVDKDLHQLGYGLLIFDGYRPWSVTKLFWDITPAENKNFVADPKKGSKHNRGCAVDLSMYDLSTGQEIEMPGVYDEMSERSLPDYKGGTEKQREMRDLLRASMEAHGFTVYEYEWWHFDYKDWPSYRIGNIPFNKIK
jgi:D-alanyl-D-alanine dipeptidase